MGVLHFCYRFALRLIPVISAVLGWRYGGWLGAVGGAVGGCVLAIVVWVAVIYVVVDIRLARWRRTISKRRSATLREIATDPAARGPGFAIGELDQRGIDES
jgi:hypothetical protein